MTQREAYQKGTERLRQAGIAEAKLDAWYLLEYVTGTSRATYFADSERPLNPAEEEQYFEWIGQREKRIPLQHLTGVQEFMGLDFLVNEQVLIPRQDTEILVETALELVRDPLWKKGKAKDGIHILDLCTGSGCILLSVLRFLLEERGSFSGRRPDEDALHTCAGESPKPGEGKVTGVGIDLSGKALELARKNGERLQIQAEFYQSDLFERVEGTYDLILSNPPYIPTAEISGLQEEVRVHDPVLALDGGRDGLSFYRRILKEVCRYLTVGGYLAFEIGAGQAADVGAMMRSAGFRQVTVRQDLAGLDRVVYGIL